MQRLVRWVYGRERGEVLVHVVCHGGSEALASPWTFAVDRCAGICADFDIGEVGDVFDHDLLGILVIRGEGWVEESAVSRSRQCPCRRCH